MAAEECRLPALRALTFALFFRGNKQFEAHLFIALMAHGKAFPRFEGGFMRQSVLRVRDFIDPCCRDHLPRLVDCLGGIGIHELGRVASAM